MDLENDRVPLNGFAGNSRWSWYNSFALPCDSHRATYATLQQIFLEQDYSDTYWRNNTHQHILTLYWHSLEMAALRSGHSLVNLGSFHLMILVLILISQQTSTHVLVPVLSPSAFRLRRFKPCLLQFPMNQWIRMERASRSRTKTYQNIPKHWL